MHLVEKKKNGCPLSKPKTNSRIAKKTSLEPQTEHSLLLLMGFGKCSQNDNPESNQHKIKCTENQTIHV
jgi:hypothetical protein